MSYTKAFDPNRAEEIILYGGDVTVLYDDVPHIYEYMGEKVQSPSQVTEILNKPAIFWWGINETLKEIELRWKPGKSYDEPYIEQAIKKAKYAHKSSSDVALNIGTIVHVFIEEFIKLRLEGIEPNILDPLDEGNKQTKRTLMLPVNAEARLAIGEFLKWHDANHLVFLATEIKVFSRKYEYGGTTDAIALVNGKLSVLDWKTSSGLWDEYWLQTAAYAKGKEEEWDYIKEQYPEQYEELKKIYPVNNKDQIRFEQMIILRTPKDGADFEDGSRTSIAKYYKRFRSALDLKKWQEEEKEAASARKAAEREVRRMERAKKQEELKAQKAVEREAKKAEREAKKLEAAEAKRVAGARRKVKQKSTRVAKKKRVKKAPTAERKVTRKKPSEEVTPPVRRKKKRKKVTMHTVTDTLPPWLE